MFILKADYTTAKNRYFFEHKKTAKETACIRNLNSL